MSASIQKDLLNLTERIKQVRSMDEKVAGAADRWWEQAMVKRDRNEVLCALGGQWRAIERVVDRLRELEGE